MNFTFMNKLFDLIDRGMDELDDAEQKKFGVMLANNESYQRVCKRIDKGVRKQREAWHTPVNEKYKRD